MASVVFLRAVNVGKANRCQPALIAKQLAKFSVVNIGAVGTFVVGENVSESALRVAFARKLPFKCEIMICPARDIIKLVRQWTDSRGRASKDPFSRQRSRREPRDVDGKAREGSRIGRRANQPSGPNIVRFVSVAARPLRAAILSDSHQTSNLKPQTSQPPPLPLSLPSDDDWLVKIIAIQDRFVLGLYRRQMKTISYLGKIEKKFGVAVTTRNWNTIEKVAKILRNE
jgi:uncharacterized protein (DUF1697 family)